MDAVTADDADGEGPQSADHIPGVMEGIWHRQNTRSQRSLQQVHERIEISVGDKEKRYVRCHVTHSLNHVKWPARYTFLCSPSADNVQCTYVVGLFTIR